MGRTWLSRVPSAKVEQQTLRLEVTQEVIDCAEACNAARCLIALAVRNKMPDATRFLADIHSIRWTDPKSGMRYMFKTPSIVADSIESFDNGRHVDPFTVVITGYAVVYSTKDVKWGKTVPTRSTAGDEPGRSHQRKEVQHFFPDGTANRYGRGERNKGFYQTVNKRVE